MAEQSEWQYCTEITKNHVVPKVHRDCLERLDFVCKNDGAKKTPFEDEICVNIDKVEESLAKKDRRDKRKIMDLSFGLVAKKESRFVLVELRLRYKNVNNLSKTELDSKILTSKSILGQSPNLLNHYYFVFNSKLKHQAHRNLRRLFANKKIVSGIDLTDLKNEFF